MTHPRTSRRATLVILLLLGALAAVLAWWLRRPPPPGPPPAPESRAMRLAGLVDAALQRDPASAAPGGSASAPALAVLPFSAPPQDEALAAIAESLCDAVLEHLSRRASPPASACHSARVAAQTGIGPAEVARLLGVRSLLTGSLRREGELLLVQASLVDARDGREQWRHEASFSEQRLRELPLRLAERLADRASAPPTPGDVRAPSGEAYSLFLQALHRHRRGGLDNLREARRLLDRTLAIAPDYPPAVRASIALDSNLVALGVGSGADVDALVRRAAERLLAVDPQGPEAALIASAAAVGARRWGEALQRLDDATTRHPNHAPLLHTQAGILLMMGYVQRGRQVAHEVALREPLNASSHERLARAWSLLGNDDRMHESASLARELGWTVQVAGFTAWHALRRGDAAAAEQAWREQLGAARLPNDWVGPMVRARLDAAARPAAIAALDAVPDAARPALNHLFVGYALAGEITRAAQALERTKGMVATMWVSDLWLPELSALRQHPAFVPWARDTGLVALWQQHGAPDHCRAERGDEWVCR